MPLWGRSSTPTAPTLDTHSSAPPPSSSSSSSSSSSDLKNQIIDEVRREVQINTAQNLIEVYYSLGPILTLGHQYELF